jgi:hypothetical protein
MTPLLLPTRTGTHALLTEDRLCPRCRRPTRWLVNRGETICIECALTDELLKGDPHALILR